jgi:hypothetical protein
MGKLEMVNVVTGYVYSTTLNYMDRSNPYRKTCVDELHAGPPYRSGGPLSIVETVDGSLEPANPGTYQEALYVGSNIAYRYTGGFHGPNQMSSFLGGYATSGESGLYDLDWGDSSTYGAQAWNRFRPAKPTADLGIFLGEIRDVPRMLKGTSKAFSDIWGAMGGSKKAFKPSNVGQHWLNTQFGWCPFIRDLSKFIKTYDNFNKAIQDLKKHNGKWLKRSGTVQNNESESVIASSSTTAHVPSLPSMFYQFSGHTGDQKTTLVEYDKVWFAGRFKYYLDWLKPDTDDPLSRTRLALRQFGFRISPSLLWELTPFSWLVDWHLNIGNVLSNIDAMLYDNLTAKYAYVMRTRRKKYVINSSLLLKTGTYNATWEYSVESKARVVASPFGFGLDPGSFSWWQWSILAALGFSKLGTLNRHM